MQDVFEERSFFHRFKKSECSFSSRSWIYLYLSRRKERPRTVHFAEHCAVCVTRTSYCKASERIPRQPTPTLFLHSFINSLTFK